jgi:hypothetical protein
MKTLGLCFLFLSSVLVVNAPAQEQPNAPQLNTDKAAIQRWLASKGQTKWLGIEGDRIFLSPDDDNGFLLPLGDQEPSCVYMRTYRVKREASSSDVTRPAGYTTCVPVARFAMKRTAEPKLEPRAQSEY